ncbi:transposase [Microbacterium sp. SSW1-49]|uniref:Transposase n=1 Tax=Microbacterium croceum TaxID=2851645 RepID=A0ABT0FDS9_9MICO|nr:transposase [Microbacterium croceum]MCK2036220.1 transposase [Microbacterium croceum]
MTDTALSTIAATLYAELPCNFISARDARVKAADGGELAAQIKALRKPSVAAWVVNLFAQERTAQLAEALRLAEELRKAQADLDAATLAKLGRERRTLTRRLAQNAVELATSRGERISASTLDAVERTISAAFFDPDAAAAVASGRLVRELDPSESVDLGAAVGGGTPEAPAPPAVPADEVSARRERRAAQRALRDAEQARERAEHTQMQAEKAHRDAAARMQSLEARVVELEAELAQTRTEAERARTAAAATAESEASAVGHLAEAERVESAAKDALDALIRAQSS